MTNQNTGVNGEVFLDSITCYYKDFNSKVIDTSSAILSSLFEKPK